MDPDHALREGDLEATRWFARLRAPGCSPAERESFRAWMDSNPAHVAAYQRATTAALSISDGLKSDPELKSMLESALADKADANAEGFLPRWFGRPLLGGALALLCAFLVGQELHQEGAAPVAEQRLLNDGNSRRAVRLADGSLVTLDVGSEVTVRIQSDSRELRLIAGRAFFEVAHDAHRPFSVEAGETRTTALGTRFEVDLRDALASVTLAQGSVSVVAVDDRAAWSRLLVPGQQLVSHGQAAPEVRRVDVAQTVAWSTGQLHFSGIALREVVTEWNRYARVRITLGDSSIADSRIVGTFQAGGDSKEFVTALASVLPIRAVPVGSDEILLVRDY